MEAWLQSHNKNQNQGFINAFKNKIFMYKITELKADLKNANTAAHDERKFYIKMPRY